MANGTHASSVFDKEKARVLEKADLSRKGSVDAPIRDLVQHINAQNDSYTTSSCSGRTVVFCEEQGQRKKGCHWLLVSHDPITMETLNESLVDACAKNRCLVENPQDDGDLGYTFIKFEPFVLHVMCRTMESAQAMLQVSVGSGFRNSGITCGRKGKVMLAVRSTHSLEVPLCHGSELLVTEQYLGHLVKLCNNKFSENTQRIQRLFQQLQSLKSGEQVSAQATIQASQVKNKAKGSKTENTPRTQKHRTDGVTDSRLEELYIDDLFEESC